jgi:capsular polysaccharide export protein
MKDAAFIRLLNGKKFLFLQGPMGPFFNNLARFLESYERETLNVVFNGGDQFYCRKRHSVSYQKTSSEFPGWLSEIQLKFNFDSILCFGDCRPLHQAAKVWAQNNSVRFLVFEEGYLRPHFITLEEEGVNANSPLSRDADFYHSLPEPSTLIFNNLASSTIKRMSHAVWYCLMCWYHRHDYKSYQHHKSISIMPETVCWMRSFWRKPVNRLKQVSIAQKIKKELSGNYYLAVLQVYNDSQVHYHSDYKDIENYIGSVIHSFYQSAPQGSHLLFKHHPMDRGHRDYAELIEFLSHEAGISGRVLYVHDLPIDDLLFHSRAVVTINSTVGISALIKSKPLKVLGRALYDIAGMTFQEDLRCFWQADFQPNEILVSRFIHYLRENTQLNMGFYEGGDYKMRSD